MTATLNSPSLYELNQGLYESSISLKNELNLMAERIAKMDEHRNGVSDSVYLRVKNDYLVKYDHLKKSFETKKKEIQRALHILYKGRQEQQGELQKHRDILEEAKFRNFLGEYTDDKAKEVENRELAEVKTHENLLAMVEGNIRQYEEVIGGPIPEFQIPPVAPSPSRDREELTPRPSKFETRQPQNSFPETRTAEARTKETQPKKEEESYFVGGDYFEQEQPTPSFSSSQPQPRKTKDSTSFHREVTPAKKQFQEDENDDDSIAAILEKIPLHLDDEETSNAFQHAAERETPVFHQKIKAAKLTILEGESETKEFKLGETTSLGRSPANDVVLKEAKISRQHATIQYRDGNFIIVDLKSSNGVYVNGNKIEEAALRSGDKVSIGSYKMAFQLI